MFGANLKYVYPFFAAITASGIAALICTAGGTLASSVGIGGLPAIIAIYPKYWVVYGIAMAVALFGSFFLTFMFKGFYEKRNKK